MLRPKLLFLDFHGNSVYAMQGVYWVNRQTFVSGYELAEVGFTIESLQKDYAWFIYETDKLEYVEYRGELTSIEF